MEHMTEETARILTERFGKDSIIALATEEAGLPHVRNVDGYYEDGAFYVITYALSNKMQQIAKNPAVAISGEWFTAHGRGVDLGYFGSEQNKAIADKLRRAFAAWIDNGHNDFDDENTRILRVQLADGVLFADGARFEIDFAADA